MSNFRLSWNWRPRGGMNKHQEKWRKRNSILTRDRYKWTPAEEAVPWGGARISRYNPIRNASCFKDSLGGKLPQTFGWSIKIALMIKFIESGLYLIACGEGRVRYIWGTWQQDPWCALTRIQHALPPLWRRQRIDPEVLREVCDCSGREDQYLQRSYPPPSPPPLSWWKTKFQMTI